MGQYSPSGQARRPAMLLRLIAGAWRALPRLVKGQPMSETPRPIDEAALAGLVDRYQRLLGRLAAARDSDEHERVRDELRDALEGLWPMLEALTRPLAWSWVRRHLSDLGGSRGARDALDGVTTSMCMHILDSLAASPISPSPPIGPLLKRIASNRMIDELRYSRRHSPDQPAPAGPPPPPPPPPPLPPFPLPAAHSPPPHPQVDLPLALDDRLYREQCLEAIGLFWRLRLSAVEREIVAGRLADPPLPYDAIAAALAPPWSPAAVRKRYSRIIADTRSHLRAIDLLPALQDHR